MPKYPNRSTDATLKALGVRSGLEGQLKETLTMHGVSFLYEALTLPYIQPEVLRKYTPDFILIDNGIVVESKGRFVTADRKKHLLIKKQYPDLDLRFVFSRSLTRISKQSQTTYAKWCETNGFRYADKYIPRAWVEEPPNLASLRFILRLFREKKK